MIKHAGKIHIELTDMATHYPQSELILYWVDLAREEYKNQRDLFLSEDDFIKDYVEGRVREFRDYEYAHNIGRRGKL